MLGEVFVVRIQVAGRVEESSGFGWVCPVEVGREVGAEGDAEAAGAFAVLGGPVVVAVVGELSVVGREAVAEGLFAFGGCGGGFGFAGGVLDAPPVDVQEVGVEVVAALGVDHRVGA